MDSFPVFPRQSNDSNVASSRGGSPSLSGLVSTLVPALLIFAAYVVFFLILRARHPHQYAPRTYLGSLLPQERTPALPKSFLGWLKPFNQLPDTFVLQHNSLDGYFLLRYLKISVIICLVGCCITWPVLFPINATGGNGEKQLNILSFSNVANANKFYAHAFIAWIFIGFVFVIVTRELLYYINLRQAYLLSPLYASRISSRTVLFTSVPTAYADETKMRRMFSKKLKNVWITSDTKALSDMVDQRTKTAMKLEAAETRLIRLANDARLKIAKKGGSFEEQSVDNTEAGEEDLSGSVAAKYVPAKKRPTHRLKFLIGKKVDTINWSRQEIERLQPLIDQDQRSHKAGEAKSLHAAIVEFYDQTEAQAAFQMVAHHQPLHMSPRFIGFVPGEVVWSNLAITWKTRTIREILTISAIVATIIFWSIPVAVVGAISNITYIVKVAPFLSFILKCPTVILGLITNLLPVVMVVPSDVAAARIPSLYGEDLWHTHSFRNRIAYSGKLLLVSGHTSFLGDNSHISGLRGGTSDYQGPRVSHEPLGFEPSIGLKGLTFSSGALLQIVGLILAKVLGRILDSTPRKMYTRWSTLSSIGWATTFPVIELLTVISITYSAIAPLMLGFSTIGLWLFYIAFRYNLLFVNTSDVDTKGLVYAKALKHTLVGCYLSVVCLIGLFAIKTGSDVAALGPLILMIILLIFMTLYHISLNAAVEPLLHYLPRSLEAEEETLLGHAKGGTSKESSDTVTGEKNSVASEAATKVASLGPAPHTKPSMMRKFFRPDIYTDYATMRRLVPHDFAEIRYDPDTEAHAYQHPAVIDEAPLLWIPRDQMGVSRQEIAHTEKLIPMTDEGAFFDEKGRIVWDVEGTYGRPPVYEDKVYY